MVKQTKSVKQMIKFKVGDRIKGKNTHLGRVGTIVELAGASPYIGVKWDNAKRKSWVSHTNLELDDNSLLGLLSREDLIQVIATLYDTFLPFDAGHGMDIDSADTLNTIGSICLDYCLKNDFLGLPEVEVKSND